MFRQAAVLTSLLAHFLALTTAFGGLQRSGYQLGKTPSENKGTSWSVEERERHGLRGLFPAGPPQSLDLKVELVMQQLATKTSPLEKYIYLHTILDADETLYYATLIGNTAQVMPFVYTPTVGEACQKWSSIFRHQPRGLYISSNDHGHIREILDHWPHDNVKVICFTDGERILGLGDLGGNGMGIPIGKLALYTACAGINPSQCLPVQIDVGCNTPAVVNDVFYTGLRQPRLRGPAYDALIAEFITAAQSKYGRNVLIQFEDFGNSNAFRLLDAHAKSACIFNDDIQGTASVVLAGVLSTLKLCKKKDISEHTFVFLGAGEAGVGIANMVAVAISKARGCSLVEARKQIWLVDSIGLLHSERPDVKSGEAAHHKVPFAHALEKTPETYIFLETAIDIIKPTALIGVSAKPGTFTPKALTSMAENNPNPLVFALSNPTSKAECTAVEAYTHTRGRCVFASGSPFDSVTLPSGETFTPGQGNNAYIFPGVGLGALVSGAMELTDDDFYVAAVALSKLVDDEALAKGCAYPPLSQIRHVSAVVAAAVAENVINTGRGSEQWGGKAPSTSTLISKCKEAMYEPKY